MFLNSLSSEEKIVFKNLAIAMIKADGIVEESETQILAAYANEMQIPMDGLEADGNVDDSIKELAQSSTPQAKRIIFLELLALAFSDGNYAPEEKELIKKLAEAFQLDQAFIERSINLEDAYMAAYSALVHLIEKGE